MYNDFEDWKCKNNFVIPILNITTFKRLVERK